MSDFQKHFPDAETMLALEPEELAGYLLEFFQSIPESSRRRNVMYVEWLDYSTGRLDEKYNCYPDRFHERISMALMEALSWLEREGLVAPWKAGHYFITRRGQALKRRADVDEFRKRAGLPKHILHPILVEKAWPAFLRGEYETSVFQAFKEVEVAVRTGGRFAPTDLGTDLMRKAFNPTRSILRSRSCGARVISRSRQTKRPKRSE